MLGRALVVLLVATGLTAAPASAKRGPINTKVTVAGKAASAQITVAAGGSISLKARDGYPGDGALPRRRDGAGHARQREAGDQALQRRPARGC